MSNLHGGCKKMALVNKKIFYNLLFQATAETLLEVADPNISARKSVSLPCCTVGVRTCCSILISIV